VGEEAYEMFKKMHLEEDPPTMKFHDKMTKQNLKTFSNVDVKKANGKGKVRGITEGREKSVQAHNPYC